MEQDKTDILIMIMVLSGLIWLSDTQRLVPFLIALTTKQVPATEATGLFEGAEGAQAGSGTTMPGGQIGGSLPSGTIGPLNPFGPGMSTTSTAASAVPGLGSLLGDLTP